MSRLKDLREQKGFTQGMVAIKSHVPVRTIQAYEQSYRELSKASGKTLYRLANALECSVEDLIKEDDE